MIHSFPFPWDSHGKNGNPDFPFPLHTSNTRSAVDALGGSWDGQLDYCRRAEYSTAFKTPVKQPLCRDVITVFMTCPDVSAQYTRVTDGQTDGQAKLPWLNAIASSCKTQFSWWLAYSARRADQMDNWQTVMWLPSITKRRATFLRKHTKRKIFLTSC